MAFKPLSSKEGFNAMAHLDADTIKFAMLLRNGGGEEEEDIMKGLNEEERKILEEENKRKRAEARQKPCAMSSCKQVEASVAYCLIERVSLFKALEKARTALDENVDEYEALQTQSTAHTLEADALQQTLQALQYREKKELKEQLALLNKAKAQMEGALAKVQEEMAELQQKASGGKEQQEGASGVDPMGRSSRPHRSNLPDLNFLLHPSRLPRVHTGSYCTVASGRKMWSCCLVEEEEAGGCSDDHSTRDKEHFVWKHREAYRPFTVAQAHWKAQHDDKLAALHAPVGLSSQQLRQSRQGASRGWDGGGSSLESYFPARPLAPALSPAVPSSQSAAAVRPALKGAPSSSPPSPSNVGRPATVGSSARRAATSGGRGSRAGGTFSPSVSFLLPGADSPLGASITSLQGGSPTKSPSLTGRGYNGSLYSTASLQPSPQHALLSASLIAPIVSLLPPTNASITTFGDTHDPPRLPCYVKEPAVAPGWESAHTRSLDAGSFFYASDRAAGMTTNQRFQTSMRAAVHTPYARPASPGTTFGAAIAPSSAGPPSPLKLSPSPGKKGQIRVLRDASIKRIGGRPLTSYWGPHLALTSTVSPSTDLENLSRRMA